MGTFEGMTYNIQNGERVQSAAFYDSGLDESYVEGESIEWEFNGFTFWPYCPYNFEFNSTLANGDPLPEWITFNPRDEDGNWHEDWWIINNEDILTQMGLEYEIMLTTKVFDYYTYPDQIPTRFQDETKCDRINWADECSGGDQQYDNEVTWTLKMTYFEVIIPNNPATFTISPPPSFDVYLNQPISFKTGPVIDDAIEDNVRIQVILDFENDLSDEIYTYTIDDLTHELTLVINPTSEEHLGSHPIAIFVMDDIQETEYFIDVEIRAPLIIEVVEEVVEEEEVIENEPVMTYKETS